MATNERIKGNIFHQSGSFTGAATSTVANIATDLNDPYPQSGSVAAMSGTRVELQSILLSSDGDCDMYITNGSVVRAGPFKLAAGVYDWSREPDGYLASCDFGESLVLSGSGDATVTYEARYRHMFKKGLDVWV